MIQGEHAEHMTAVHPPRTEIVRYPSSGAGGAVPEPTPLRRHFALRALELFLGQHASIVEVRELDLTEAN